MTDDLSDYYISVKDETFKKTKVVMKNKSTTELALFFINLEEHLNDFIKLNPALTEEQWNILNKCRKNFDKFYKGKVDVLID